MTNRKPNWLRAKLPNSPAYKEVREIVDTNKLHTVCQSAQCPNMGECWSRGTATVMILGNVCTRSCSFCAIETGRPTELDLGEPARVAEAVRKMNLKHCVITSVTRDELPDGGASVWASTIRAIRYLNPYTAIEVLTPDFQGNTDQLEYVPHAKPDIFQPQRRNGKTTSEKSPHSGPLGALRSDAPTRQKTGLHHENQPHARRRRNKRGNSGKPRGIAQRRRQHCDTRTISTADTETPAGRPLGNSRISCRM